MDVAVESESKPALALVAEELADRHHVLVKKPGRLDILHSIDDVRRWLDRIREACVAPPPEAGKAAEWLLDNDYQVHRAIRQIAQDLPPSFLRRLPSLPEEQGGRPRITALAGEMLRAAHLQLTHASAAQFVAEYQRYHTLTIAELWALPTMLRITCLEVLIAAFDELFEGAVAAPVDLTQDARCPVSLEATLL